MTDQLSRVFAALADPTRRDMVARLTEGDHTVNDLAAPYDVSLQAVSKHLKVLEDAGLVTRTREAQRRPVHLEAEVFDLMTKWIERYRRQAEERFARLDAVLARCRTTTTQHHRNPYRKEPHHDHHADQRHDHPLPRGRDPGRRARARHPHLARLRRHPRPAVPGAHRPRALRAVDRADDVGADITHWEARDGGSWSYTARGSDGREEFETSFRGCFHTVREDRIVQTFTWEGMPDGVALETMTFEDLGDGRTRLHAVQPLRLLRGPRRLAAQRHGGRRQRRLRRHRPAPRRGHALMALPDAPADRHAAVAGGFGRLVAQTPDWSAPAPGRRVDRT